MNRRGFRRFFVSIVLPTILAIVLFVIFIYIIILPSFEKNMMEGKKEMIRELTLTAWSLVDDYNNDLRNGLLSEQEARTLAAGKIEQLRYGEEDKDYFWIIDMQPLMIMHPYRKELNGTRLDNYQDPEGKRLFVEAVNVARQSGEGYIDYLWQWKDDSTRIVPKLSYVKAYPEWEWVIGTGIYLEDVKTQIVSLERNLIRVSLLITLVIVILLFYIIRQSLSIERERTAAEQRLKQSREKYRLLVEASTEGTLMVVNGKFIFANQRFKRLYGDVDTDLSKVHFDDLFTLSIREVREQINDTGKSLSCETSLTLKSGKTREVVISVSKVKMTGQDGYIVVVKNVDVKKGVVPYKEWLEDDLQASLLLMNMKVKSLLVPASYCTLNTSAREAAGIMGRKRIGVLLVRQEEAVIGYLTDRVLCERILAADRNPDQSLSDVMLAPAPLIPEDALVHEALLQFKRENCNYLFAKSPEGNISGVISREEIYRRQQTTVTNLLNEAGSSESFKDLRNIYNKLTVLVQSLLETGSRISLITRIQMLVSDSIVKRVIALVKEGKGEAPCPFAFMVMGSEGRGEQTLLTDQDNALIYQCTDTEKDRARSWFLDFAEQVNEGLNQAGFRFCKGDVMARNPKWNLTLTEWKKTFGEWIRNAEPDNVLKSSIFFDFRGIFGELELVDELDREVNEMTRGEAIFFHHLAQSVLKFKLPLGLMGGISAESSGEGQVIDIKKILMPIVSYARLMALQHQISARNTLERLDKIYFIDALSESFYKELIQSYSYLMKLRFKTQSDQLARMEPEDNLVDLEGLTEIEMSTLKKILSVINNLQSQVRTDYKIGN